MKNTEQHDDYDAWAEERAHEFNELDDDRFDISSWRQFNDGDEQ